MASNTAFFARHGLNVNNYVTVNNSGFYLGNSTSNVVMSGGTITINGWTQLPSWANIAPSAKQDASSNLSTYSTSANIAGWHALATSAKQDASSNLATYSTSANIAGWHALATSSKVNTSDFTWSNLGGKPTAISTWTNDSGYITSSSLSSYLALSGGTMTGLITGRTSGLAMSQDSGATQGSFVCRATSTGDSNLAGLTLYNDSYAIKLGVRADGYVGFGGWSRAAWSWYSDPSGNMVAAGNVTAYSDPKLKERFEKLNNALDIISRLNGGTFYWRHGIPHIANKAGKRDYGILANEVEAVMPEIVSDSISLEGEVYKTVSYEKLVPVLIEAIKELKEEIDLLKKGKI